jgi:hypothetical protein
LNAGREVQSLLSGTELSLGRPDFGQKSADVGQKVAQVVSRSEESERDACTLSRPYPVALIFTSRAKSSQMILLIFLSH